MKPTNGKPRRNPTRGDFKPKTELGKLALECIKTGKKLTREELIREVRRAKYGE